LSHRCDKGKSNFCRIWLRSALEQILVCRWSLKPSSPPVAFECPKYARGRVGNKDRPRGLISQNAAIAEF
jgi:hypothetical protein